MIARSRRVFLASVSTLALLAAIPAAFGASTGPPEFYGNPNANIESIDFSSGIEVPVIGGAARDSGEVPFFLHVSASAIKCAGTIVGTNGNALGKINIRPYEDLEYWWDFGDPKGRELFTNPVAGTQVNANIHQYGPEAAYCYRVPGTYNVTLHIRGKRGSSYITASVTRRISVNAYNASGGHWYFDSHYDGSKGAPNGSITRPFTDLKNMNLKANVARAAIHLKCGSSWVYGGGPVPAPIFIQNTSPLRIDSYGTGGKPSLRSIFHSAIAFSFNLNYQDIVISGLNLTTNPPGDGAPINLALGNTRSAKYIYQDNCEFVSNVSKAGCWNMFPGSAADAHGGNQGVNAWPCGGTWNCVCSSSIKLVNVAYFGATQWMFHVGLTATIDTQYHHINPENSVDHVLMKWLYIKGTIDNKVFSACQSLRARSYVGAINRYQLVSECWYDQGQTGVNVNDHAPYDSAVLNSLVIERSRFSNLQQNVTYLASIGTFTWRDNEVWGCDAITEQHIVVGTKNQGGVAIYNVASGNLYRNKHFRAGGNSHIFNVSYNSGGVATTPQPWQITDNVIEDLRPGSGADILAFHAPNQQTAGTLIDRNQYWAPNSNGAYMRNPNSVSLAVIQAQGFDVHGTSANPHWIDPANGRFGN